MIYVTLYEWCQIVQIPYSVACDRLRDHLDRKRRCPIGGPSLKPFKVTRRKGRTRLFWVRTDSVWIPGAQEKGKGYGTFEGDEVAISIEMDKDRKKQALNALNSVYREKKKKSNAKSRENSRSLLRAVNRVYRREISERLKDIGATRPDKVRPEARRGLKELIDTRGLWKQARGKVEAAIKAGNLKSVGVEKTAKHWKKGPWIGRKRFAPGCRGRFRKFRGLSE